ncbi:MAG: M28 family metallopeptidase [Rudanella sp.]|nr:M28 family metallopeptidase [Rudanella sp.]
MLLAAILATLEAFGVGGDWLRYARYGFMAYFVLQAITGTVGYYLHGYSNGASDNATGVVAALETADRLRRNKPADVDLEVVLTSAEELGMIGAYYYVEAHRNEWPRGRTAAINFDTLGAGKLTIIEQTGTVEVIRYENSATNLARQLIQHESFIGKAKVGKWHTADFDSVWFVRQNIPVLALCALDEKGKMPRIHRPDDTLDHVDLTPMHTAIDLAEMIFRRLSVAL